MEKQKSTPHVLRTSRLLHSSLFLRMPQIHSLGGAHPAAELDLVADFLQRDFEASEHGHQVQKIVIPKMSDAEHLALHRPLPIGKNGAESRAHFLDDFGGFDPRR